MKITNNHKLPDLFLSAVRQQADDYDMGDADISVTSLVAPPLIDHLKRKYGSVEDVMDMVYTLQGTAMHKVLECAARNDPDRYRSEKRLFIEHDGWRISGQMDVYDSKHELIADLKNAAISTFKGGVKKEYVAQLNLLAFLARNNGYQVERLANWAVYRDWSKMKAYFSPGYKQVGIEVFPVMLWTDEKCESYMSERIAIHKRAREEGPEICSPEERWQDPDRDEWLVVNTEKKSTYRVRPTEAEAIEVKDGMKTPGNYHIEKRAVEPEPMRCLLYCNVSHQCSFAREYFKKLQNEKQ